MTDTENNLKIALAGVLSAGLMYFAMRKTTPQKVHVLVVAGKFKSKDDRDKWVKCWSPLAKRVRENEPNCLSYELSYVNGDDTKIMIFERYVNKSDLDGIH